MAKIQKYNGIDIKVIQQDYPNATISTNDDIITIKLNINEPKCLKCGKCCKKIPIQGKIKDYEKQLSKDEYDFIVKHWHKIKELAIDPDDKIKRYPNTNWYACDLLLNNACSIYEDKLDICNNYPIGLATGISFETDCPSIREYKKQKGK